MVACIVAKKNRFDPFFSYVANKNRFDPFFSDRGLDSGSCRCRDSGEVIHKKNRRPELMRSPSKIILFGAVFSLSMSAAAETPADIFREMDARKRASLSGIDEFSQMKVTMGMCTLEHFEKATTESVDGRGTVAYMRLVPITEVMERRNPDSALAQATPGELDNAADMLDLYAPAMDQEMRQEMQDAGLPGNLSFLLAHPPADEPWLSPMPNDMMGNYATMLRGAAEGKRMNARIEAEQEQQAQQDPIAALAEATRIVGQETIIDRPAIHLVSEGLNYTQGANGQEFTLNTMHLWVDAEKYVPLKMQMDGVAVDGGESRAMRIEREDQAYRKVAGCIDMYEPQRSVMRMSGVLNAEEQAQMEEARVKLAELKTQLAALPPSQQDMIMRQMGPQLEMFEKMAAGQGIEVSSLTVGMRCNGGLPTEKEYMQTVPGVSQASCIGFAD
jgi:hypothetical protein